MIFTLREMDTSYIMKTILAIKWEIQFLSLILIVKMSTNLETITFVTFCYVLEKLDVWRVMEQLADDWRAFSTLHWYT